MSKSAPKVFYGWYLVFACWMMIFLQYSVSFGVFFKPILEEFKWDRVTLSSVQSIGLLAFTVVSPFLGRLLDKVGPRIMISVGVLSQIISACLTGIASSIWYLYVARFTFWINAYPGSQVLTNKWFIRMRGTALGVLSSALPIGTLVLTPITQFLIISWNWRTTMLFWAGIMTVVLIPLLFIIRNRPEDKGLKPDGEPLNNDEKQQYKKTGNNTKDKFANDSGHTFSVITRTGAFWLLCVSQFACGIGCGFMMTHIVIFATDVGFSDMIGATLLSIQGGFCLVGVLVLGYLSDRMVRKNTLALTYLIRAVSFSILIVFTMFASNSLWLLYLAMALFGIGWFTTAPLTAGVAADLYGNIRLGTILGITTACHMLGMTIGAFLGGAIFDATKNYLLFFLIQFPVELAAMILVFSIRRQRLTSANS